MKLLSIINIVKINVERQPIVNVNTDESKLFFDIAVAAFFRKMHHFISNLIFGSKSHILRKITSFSGFINNFS